MADKMMNRIPMIKIFIPNIKSSEEKFDFAGLNYEKK